MVIQENGLMKEITEKQFDEMNDHKKYRVYLNSCGIGSLQSFCERSYIEIIWKEKKYIKDEDDFIYIEEYKSLRDLYDDLKPEKIVYPSPHISTAKVQQIFDISKLFR